MPYTKLSKGTSKVDWFVAAILWAKATKNVHWNELASRVGINPHTLRNLCVNKRSDEWQLYTLKKTLKELGLSYMEILSMMEDE